MKGVIVNIVATTGLALVILSMFVRLLMWPYHDLYFSTVVMQIFGANIVIHLGLRLTRKLESKYLALEVLLDMAYICAVVMVFGWVFDWFGAAPILILVVTAVVVHLVALFLNMARVREEANVINKLLKKRDKKQGLERSKLPTD